MGGGTGTGAAPVVARLSKVRRGWEQPQPWNSARLSGKQPCPRNTGKAWRIGGVRHTGESALGEAQPRKTGKRGMLSRHSQGAQPQEACTAQGSCSVKSAAGLQRLDAACRAHACPSLPPSCPPNALPGSTWASRPWVLPLLPCAFPPRITAFLPPPPSCSPCTGHGHPDRGCGDLPLLL